MGRAVPDDCGGAHGAPYRGNIASDFKVRHYRPCAQSRDERDDIFTHFRMAVTAGRMTYAAARIQAAFYP